MVGWIASQHGDLALPLLDLHAIKAREFGIGAHQP